MFFSSAPFYSNPLPLKREIFLFFGKCPWGYEKGIPQNEFQLAKVGMLKIFNI